MMIFNKRIKFLAIAICLFLFSCLNVNAASLSFNGSSSVIIGNTFEITLAVGNVGEDQISGINGELVYDTNYLELESATNLAPFSISYMTSVNKIAGFAIGNNIVTATNLMKFKFKTKNQGSTTISLTGIKITDANSNPLAVNAPSKTITITPPPSTNANLSSLSLSSGSLSFNKDTTSYNVDVESNVSSININATVEDSGAKVSGTGTKSLNYGSNTISIIVTAASGDKKTYTININRKDDRSTNNNLGSLSVTGYTISPKFNASTTTYSMEVPFEISAITVNAAPADDKAKATVSNQNRLTAGKTTAVKVVVTAENGSTKTYTINVKRAPDPNKVLATNNDLASLSIKDVELSPVFSKDITEYTAEVTYDITELEFLYEASDKEYGTVSMEGPEELKAGENKYIFTVTAEDGSTKKYTVIITKEKNPDGSDDEPIDDNDETLDQGLVLKELKLKNGQLIGKFNPNTYVYRYKKGENFTFDAIPQNEEDTVTIFEHEGVYTIIIEDSEGNQNVYTLIPKDKNIMIIIISGVSVVFISGGTFLGYKLGLKKDKPTKKIKAKSKKVKAKEGLAEN